MRGARFVLVVCKATFLLAPTTATLSGAQDPILDEDKRWDDKPDRSVFAPADIVPFKRDVDLVLVGHAFAPGGAPSRSIMTRICVGDVDKSIVIGTITALLTFPVTGAVLKGVALLWFAFHTDRGASPT